jgi:hypothetical protein
MGFIKKQFSIFFAIALSVHTLHAQVNSDSLFHEALTLGIDYNTFSCRARCNWKDDKLQMDFQASIRMVKDSLIWGSVTGPLGIEAARFLITKDSFRLISNLSKEYIVSDVTYVQRWLSLPLSFDQLQHLVAGQLVLVENAVTDISINDSSSFIIYQESPKLFFKHILNPQSYTFNLSVLKDKLLDQSISTTFGRADSLGGKMFPVNRSMIIERGKETMNLQMEFFKYSINESLSFPFEINTGFKRIE